IESVDRGGPAPGGQLHQRRRMRHRPVQRNPAEPPPGDRIADLPTQRLIAQPVAELQEHQPQIGFHRRRGTPDPQVEKGTNGVKNAGSSNNASTRANSSGNFSSSGGSTASHSDI